MFRLNTTSSVLLFLAVFCIWLLASHVQSRSPTGPFGGFDWEKAVVINYILANRKLRWHKCYSTFQCAILQVPLDYAKQDGTSAAIALIRLRSQFPVGSPKYRGPILFNPGGPGGRGVDFILVNGERLSLLLGPQFDIIGFDPRGIGRSSPQVKFFNSLAERALWMEGEYPDALNASADVLPRSWARAQLLGQMAEERNSNVLQHITTENIARDMLSIVQACGHEKVQYWGFSWGTILGTVFASLFPDRVERMVLDGVIDADDYFATRWFNNLIDTDTTLQHFFDECFKVGPDVCAFHAPSPVQISQRLDKLYESIRTRPVSVHTGVSYGVVDYSLLRRAVFTALYFPYALFGPLAKALSALQAGDGRALFDLVPRPRFECRDADRPFHENSYEAGTSLHCIDGDEVTDSVEELEKFYHEMAKYSSLAELWAIIRIRCSGWRVRNSSRFKGPFQGNTSFPILLVANTADPVAPLAAATNTSQKFPGSVVLIQDAPGHCSLSGASMCTHKYIRRYFRHGRLPKHGVRCPVNQDLFTDEHHPNASDDDLQYVVDRGDREVYRILLDLSHSFRISPIP